MSNEDCANFVKSNMELFAVELILFIQPFSDVQLKHHFTFN